MRMNDSRVGCTGIVYDGYNVSDAFQVVDVSIPLLPTVSAVTHDIAQHPGSYFASRNIGTREIKIKLKLDAETRDPIGVYKAWSGLSSVFNKSEPKKLYIDDDMFCMAMMVGGTDITDEAYYGVVEFTFTCFDPYFYGAEHDVAVSDGTTASFVVHGGVEAYPTLELTSTSETVVVTNIVSGEYVRITSVSSGSKITVDMERQIATIGGEYCPVDLLSDFFSVDGDAKVKVSGASGTLRYMERWL